LSIFPSWHKPGSSNYTCNRRNSSWSSCFVDAWPILCLVPRTGERRTRPGAAADDSRSATRHRPILAVQYCGRLTATFDPAGMPPTGVSGIVRLLLHARRETMLRGHPALQAFFTLGWFSVISHWPAGQRQNPVVVVCWATWGRTQSALCGAYAAFFSAALPARLLGGRTGSNSITAGRRPCAGVLARNGWSRYAGRLEHRPAADRA